ncbi:MAG: DegT/DnrJ/EryC1/StrS family aminotransferase [Acidobacteria bacterium]|nr:DegT/DnrJ/EryC1/StrS family aminotransferase [Acidobacteriota bacterium]MBI3658574.1 DegT/DnrJ/EryC1/StrS family aminotransferase [Acidobacteriota bacterium]
MRRRILQTNNSARIPQSSTQEQYVRHKAEFDSAIAGVLERSWFILGQEGEQFEQEFAAYIGVAHAIGCGNGTEAIQIALQSVGVGHGDEVITSPHTALFTVLGISATGATPVFADINPTSFNIDPEAVAAKITPRTRAVLPVHLYGQAADLTPLLELTRARRLKLVEDCAQAHGATYGDRRVGSIGDAAAFSFYPTKNLGAFGDGGMVTVNDAAVAERARLLRNGGRSDYYHHPIVGLNSRLDEIQAAVLRVKLRHLDSDNAARRQRAALYTALLKDSRIVSSPTEMPYGRSVNHLYVVRTAARDALRDFLAAEGIDTQIHYRIPAHLQEAYAHLGYRRGDLPHAERAADEVLSLPLWPELSLGDAERAARTILRFRAG